MAAPREVTFIISARDRTRAVFRRIGRSVRNLRLGLGSLIGGGLIAGAARAMLRFAESIDAASQRLEVTRETLQGLRILADNLNIPFESLQGVMQRIAREGDAAADGSERSAKAFAAFGVSIRDLQTLTDEELFFRIADAVAQAAANGRDMRNELAKVGETEAVRLIALFKQGGDSLKEQIRLLKQQGAIQSDEAIVAQAQAAAKVRQELLEVQKEFTDIAIKVLPELTAAALLLAEALNAAPKVGRAISQEAFERTKTPAARADTLRRVLPYVIGGPSLGNALRQDLTTIVLKKIEENTRDGNRLS